MTMELFIDLKEGRTRTPQDSRFLSHFPIQVYMYLGPIDLVVITFLHDIALITDER